MDDLNTMMKTKKNGAMNRRSLRVVRAVNRRKLQGAEDGSGFACEGKSRRVLWFQLLPAAATADLAENKSMPQTCKKETQLTRKTLDFLREYCCDILL